MVDHTVSFPTGSFLLQKGSRFDSLGKQGNGLCQSVHEWVVELPIKTKDPGYGETSFLGFPLDPDLDSLTECSPNDLPIPWTLRYTILGTKKGTSVCGCTALEGEREPGLIRPEKGTAEESITWFVIHPLPRRGRDCSRTILPRLWNSPISFKSFSLLFMK